MLTSRKRCLDRYFHHEWESSSGRRLCVRCRAIHKLDTTLLERIWEKVDRTTTPDGCWTWKASFFKCGYGKTSYKGSINNAHRVIWILLNGDPGDLVVMHTCDNYACVRPSHLRLGTQRENLHDMTRKGRNGAAILTPAQVVEIRHLHKHGHASSDLAQKFGVKPCTIYNLLAGRTWKALDSHLMQNLKGESCG